MRFFHTLVHSVYSNGAYIANRTVRGIVQPLKHVVFENTVIEHSRLYLTDCHFIGTVVFYQCEIIGRSKFHGDSDTVLTIADCNAFSLDVTARHFEMTTSHASDIVTATVDSMEVDLSKLKKLHVLSDEACVTLTDSKIGDIVASPNTRIINNGSNLIDSSLSVVPGFSLRSFGTGS